MRTTSIPASKRPRTNSSLARKSDNVATILVFFSPHIQLLVKLYRFKSKLHLESGIRLYPKLFRHSIAHQSFTHEHPTDRTRIVPNIFRRNPKTDTSTSRKSRKHPQHRQRSDYPQPDKRHEGHAFVIPAYKNSENPDIRRKILRFASNSHTFHTRPKVGTTRAPKINFRILPALAIFAEDRMRFGNFQEQVLIIALGFRYLCRR